MRKESHPWELLRLGFPTTATTSLHEERRAGPYADTAAIAAAT
jgi:hypothetical protein